MLYILVVVGLKIHFPFSFHWALTSHQFISQPPVPATRIQIQIQMHKRGNSQQRRNPQFTSTCTFQFEVPPKILEWFGSSCVWCGVGENGERLRALVLFLFQERNESSCNDKLRKWVSLMKE
jgi:hypothetical protein